MRSCGGLIASVSLLNMCSWEAIDSASASSVEQIFAAKCAECHHPESKSRYAKRATKHWKDARTKSTVSAGLVKHGDLGESKLWQAVTNPDEGYRMPPADAKAGPLTPQELETIRKWIEGK